MSESPGLLDCEVVTTRDGAKAIADRITGELMHPVVGPQREAEQLYLTPSHLRARLSEPSETPLVLLDAGMGAASNAIAAWRLSESLTHDDRALHIISVDHSVAALALALSTEHAHDFGFAGAAGAAARHVLQHREHATERTRWTLHVGDLLDTLDALAADSVDLVYWDPFSPRRNPRLWSLDAFRRLRRVSRERCTVHTYSGATAIRSALLLAGFHVGAGHSVGEHKQNTIAATTLSDLDEPLDARWLQRVQRSSAALPPDAPPDALDQLRELPQLGYPRR